LRSGGDDGTPSMTEPLLATWCRRHLEEVRFDGARLQVTGWAASDGGRLVDFDVATCPSAPPAY